MHRISIFAGLPSTLARLRVALPMCRSYFLLPQARIAVAPVDDAVQDALQRMNGAGHWPEEGPIEIVGLSNRDLAFAARMSSAGPLAFIETDYDADQGRQAAVLWIGGAASIGPTSIERIHQAKRAPHLWPVNSVLKALGVSAPAGLDEFAALGLDRYKSNAMIATHGRPIG